jgi:hypothetical protein
VSKYETAKGLLAIIANFYLCRDGRKKGTFWGAFLRVVYFSTSYRSVRATHRTDTPL